MPLMMVGGNAADDVLSGNAADNGDVTCDNRLYDGNVTCLAAMPLIDVLCYVLSGNATNASWASEPGENRASANAGRTSAGRQRSPHRLP